MKILLLTPDIMGDSGWGRYARDLGKALAKRGHTVTAIVHTPSKVAWAREYALLGKDVHYLGNPLLCLLSALRVRHLLRTIRPDVIHAIAEPYACLLPFLGRRWKTCMTIHGTYAVFPLILSRTARWLSVRAYRRANRILSVSNFTRSTLQQREPTLWNEIGNKVQVLGNGLDLSDIPSPSTHPRHRSARVPASILAVGAVKERKGTLEAIDACATYKQTYHHPFRFDIIGSLDHDPDYVREVRRRISQHGLQDEVRLRGRLSDALLKATYRSADLFLLLSSQSPNNFEGFGLVFLEASAQGIPVIGPTTGGCPEAIKEGKSGYICNPSDAKSIASRMHAILQEHAIKPQECRSWAESHDIHTRAETLERHYEELMKSE